MLALARKYRPKTFSAVAVQSHVSNTLKGAIARNRVANGYLLCGPRGTGKTTLARVLAMALNCERKGTADAPDGEPCGTCDSCRRIWSGSASLDVVEIDAASNRGVDDARDLRERAMYAPSADGGYKVYIVDEAHMLTREAWNALLKVLEEPPPRVVFVFATTEPQKIAQAAAPVLSRLQRFDLKRIGVIDVRDRLAQVLAEEGVTADADALAMLARAADGSMRDALSLTDQVLSLGGDAVTPERVREALGLVPDDEYLALLDLIADRRAGDVFTAIGRLADQGVDFGLVLTGLADALRAQLALTLGAVASDVPERQREALAARIGRLAPSDLLRMLAALGELEPRFRRSGQQQLLLETLLVRFALLDRTVELESVLRGLDGGSGSGAGVVRAGPSTDVRSASATLAPSPPAQPRALSAALPAEAPARPGASKRPARDATSRSARGTPPESHDTPRLDAPPHQSAASRITPSPALAPPAAAPSGGSPPDLNTIVERWDAVLAGLRAAGKTVLAGALATVEPAAVNARGEVTLTSDGPNEYAERAISEGRSDLLSALQAVVGNVTRVTLREPAAPGAGTPARRLTTEAVKSEHLSSLRRRDPGLGAAIDALDLELLD